MEDVREDEVGEVRHRVGRDLAPGSVVQGELDWAWRHALMRAHALMHVVEIVGFDAQACGGTHVHTTAEIGRARIVKFDNKGKDNKRFYWELAPPP